MTMSSRQVYVRNKRTGRYILKGGETAEKLRKENKVVGNKDRVSMPEGHSPTKEHGCSATKSDKYADVPKNMFCGPAGGSCPGTYPVDTPARWRSAKSYARFAPYPEGVRECAERIARRRGWTE
jgi:hypothetical protein